MALDPITILMFALIAVLIFFMFRNGKKRQQAMQELQNGLRPGAEVMLQSGIFGTIESIDDEDNRVTVRSGSSTLVVHRNAVSQVVTPVDAAEAEPTVGGLAPDDDPAFGERIAGERTDAADATDAGGRTAPTEGAADDTDSEQAPGSDGDSTDTRGTGEPGDEQTPKA